MRITRPVLAWMMCILPVFSLPLVRRAQHSDQGKETARQQEWPVGTVAVGAGAVALGGWLLLTTRQNQQLKARLTSMEKTLRQINTKISQEAYYDTPAFQSQQEMRRHLVREIDILRMELSAEMHRSNERLGKEMREEFRDPGGKLPTYHDELEPFMWREEEYFQQHPDRRDCVEEELIKDGVDLDALMSISIQGLIWINAIQKCLPPDDARHFFSIHPLGYRRIGTRRFLSPLYPNPFRRSNGGDSKRRTKPPPPTKEPPPQQGNDDQPEGNADQTREWMSSLGGAAATVQQAVPKIDLNRVVMGGLGRVKTAIRTSPRKIF